MGNPAQGGQGRVKRTAAVIAGCCPEGPARPGSGKAARGYSGLVVGTVACQTPGCPSFPVEIFRGTAEIAVLLFKKKGLLREEFSRLGSSGSVSPQDLRIVKMGKFLKQNVKYTIQISLPHRMVFVYRIPNT